MKKTIALLSVLALMVTFSGCMSAEEKMKAEEDERLAVPIVEKYLSENYEGAVISKTTYLERNKSGAIAVPDFGVYATGYCVSQVDYGSDDFSVIVNTDTGECWDNYGYKQIKKDIADKIKSGVDSADVEDVEVNVYYKDFPSVLWADNCVGFSKKGDDILASDKYTINVLLKCDGDISRLDYSKLKEFDIKSAQTLNHQLTDMTETENTNGFTGKFVPHKFAFFPQTGAGGRISRQQMTISGQH